MRRSWARQIVNVLFQTNTYHYWQLFNLIVSVGKIGNSIWITFYNGWKIKSDGRNYCTFRRKGEAEVRDDEKNEDLLELCKMFEVGFEMAILEETKLENIHK